MGVRSEVNLRSGTTAEWAEGDDLVLGVGELGFNETTRELKVGNGVDVFSALAGMTPKAIGRATLVAGTVTVNTTEIGATDNVFLTAQSLGTVSDAKGLAVSARVAGTSFTIISDDATDTSVVAYAIYSSGA